MQYYESACSVRTGYVFFGTLVNVIDFATAKQSLKAASMLWQKSVSGLCDLGLQPMAIMCMGTLHVRQQSGSPFGAGIFWFLKCNCFARHVLSLQFNMLI